MATATVPTFHLSYIEVDFSKKVRFFSASVLSFPQFSMEGVKFLQTSGYAGVFHIMQRCVFWSRLMQTTPAGFPFGIPGIGLDIDIAMQHAPHPGLHSN